MSLILHLETSTAVCSVALSENNVLLAYREEISEKLSHGEKLTLYIQDVLTASNKKITDLDAVSIAAGPGSYTGLRIGVSTAKGICYALSIPLIALDSLSILMEIGKSVYPNQTIAAFFDARRMEVFAQISNKNNSLILATSSLLIDETSLKDIEPFIVIGDSNEKIKPIWAGRNIRFDDNIQPSAKGQVRLAKHSFDNQLFVDVAYFEPNYVKEFYDSRVK